MKVTVNEEVVESPATAGDTLADLIDELRRCGDIRPDEVVAGLEVDSREWGAQDMDRLQSTQLEDLSQVTITTDDMTGYARRILDDAAGMLRVLREAARRIARDLRGRRPDQANRDLFQLLDAIQQFLTCLYKVQNACAARGGPIKSQRVVLALLSAALDTIVGCQEREDWIALAAQLEEHLMPALDGFEDVISSMMSQV